MGTKCAGDLPGSGRVPPVPPGFISHTSFALERVRIDDDAERTQVRNQSGVFDEDAFRKTLQRRPWLNFAMSDGNSDESSDSEVSEHDAPSVKCLPKGITRGCSKCQTCQKVIARWHPEEACRPTLDESPAFHPTDEEFKDPVKYIESIRARAETYGICRIVPPPSWKPPCPLKEESIWGSSEFGTYIQPVGRLQSGHSLDGDHKITSRKRQRILSNQGEHTAHGNDFRKINSPGYYSTTSFGLEEGPNFTLESFEKYANDFVDQYFRLGDKNAESKTIKRGWKPLVDDIEGEYWRIVEKPTEEIEVLFGANLEANKFGSGFPRVPSCLDASEDKYLDSGWNLNNTPHHPGSLLVFESGDIPGVLIPLLHVGMCFSSTTWHAEEHYLYSLSYLHFGAPKVWYGAPGRHALKLETAMKNHLPRLSAERSLMLHNQAIQCSPSFLKSEGVPVYRCVQNAGEYVLTFPQAYHCSFNCGFNCVEAVNLAPIDWLPHGQNAVEIYRDQKHPVSISHDKLLLGTAGEAVRAQWNYFFVRKLTQEDLYWRDACGREKTLVRALKARIDMESKRRDFFCRSIQSRKMSSSLDANSDRRCLVCHYDLHLSAVGCSCAPDKFACLNHANQICQCGGNKKFVLFRHAIGDLNTLADALVGKMTAVHKWAVQELGLSLTSQFSKHTNKEQDIASEASSADSLHLVDDLTRNNLQKAHMDQASGLSSLLPSQEQIFHKNARNAYPESKVGANMVSTKEKIVPQMCSVSTDKDRMAKNDGFKLGQTDTDSGQSILEREYGPLNTPNLQKGPRLAKVVQRTNCPVELLHYGTILSAKLWSTSQAIFPKGYRSRVRYLNVKDPSQMCNYISEILDAGLTGPLFMVQVEECASEVFIHTSAAKCWDLVRERINQEIRRQHSFGKFDVPPPQPPGSVDGLEMFGLTSPTIAKEIEMLDTNRACIEYWKARSQSNDPLLIATPSAEPGAKEMNIQPPQFSNTAFLSLLKKADAKELDTLRQILVNDQPLFKSEAAQILKDEISSRSKSMSGKYCSAVQF